MDLVNALQKHGLQVQGARAAAEVQGWLHSGNYALNWAISGRFLRGYPLGHMVEVFGDEATGKSYLINRAVAEAQRAGGGALLDDTEKAFNPDWAERALGIDVDALALTHSATVEDHYEAAKAFVQSVAKGGGEAPWIMALDSLALLSTRNEQQNELDKPALDRAKLLHRFMRLVAGQMASLPVTYVVANHVYTGPGMSPWERRKTTGGSATRYQSSVRLDLRTPKKVKDGKEVVATIIRVVVDKNRLTAPYKEVTMVIPYNRPISPYSGLIPVLLRLGVVETKGHTLVVEGEDTGVYAQKTNPIKQERSGVELLQKCPDLLEKADEMLAEREVSGGPVGQVEEEANGGD